MKLRPWGRARWAALIVVVLGLGAGGTGRFAGATGSFTLENTLDLTTHVSSGTFSGEIDH
jgi:hypothetical protein